MKEFTKNKTVVLKGILSVLIVLHHLSYYTDYLSIVHSWGAPIVSLFFFISGYGLMKQTYVEQGSTKYLNGFFRRRILKSLFLPFILAWLIYRVLHFNQLPGLISEWKNLLLYGNPLLPYSWYVFAIFIFYVVFYFACKSRSKYVEFIILGGVLGYITIVWSMGFGRSWYISALGFPCGIFFAKYEPLIHKYLKGYRYYLTIPLCLVLIGVSVFLEIEMTYVGVYFILPFMIACLCAKVNVEKLNNFRPFVCLSGISYEIYLYQGVSMSIFRGRYFFVQSDMLFVFSTLALTVLMAYSMSAMKSLCLSKTGWL